MREICMGAVLAFGFDYAPKNWLKCDGQILLIDEYMSLYSLLGTKYGGDGRTTFALPNIDPTGSATNGILYYSICVRGDFPFRP